VSDEVVDCVVADATPSDVPVVSCAAESNDAVTSDNGPQPTTPSASRATKVKPALASPKESVTSDKDKGDDRTHK
jgi:hypothetical protein